MPAVWTFDTPWGRMGVAATARGVVRVALPGAAPAKVGGFAAPTESAPRAGRLNGCQGAILPRPPRQLAARFTGRAPFAVRGGEPADRYARRAEREIRQYLSGRRRRFTVRLDLGGLPPFQRRVLVAARRIPYGKTATYGRLAARVGRPGAARAVGQAMARNPVPLLIPCHRVTAAGGLGGFGGGAALKWRLLALEAAGTKRKTRTQGPGFP